MRTLNNLFLVDLYFRMRQLDWISKLMIYFASWEKKTIKNTSNYGAARRHFWNPFSNMLQYLLLRGFSKVSILFHLDAKIWKTDEFYLKGLKRASAFSPQHDLPMALFSLRQGTLSNSTFHTLSMIPRLNKYSAASLSRFSLCCHYSTFPVGIKSEATVNFRS